VRPAAILTDRPTLFFSPSRQSSRRLCLRWHILANCSSSARVFHPRSSPMLHWPTLATMHRPSSPSIAATATSPYMIGTAVKAGGHCSKVVPKHSSRPNPLSGCPMARTVSRCGGQRTSTFLASPLPRMFFSQIFLFLIIRDTISSREFALPDGRRFRWTCSSWSGKLEVKANSSS
jgi:hypothetical protein